jgi:hypothetical protein
MFVSGKSPVKRQPEILLGRVAHVYMDRCGGHISSCGDCDDQFGPVSFYSPLFKPVLDCSFCEAMASIAVLSAKVAVVYSGEVGRSAVYSR